MILFRVLGVCLPARVCKHGPGERIHLQPVSTCGCGLFCVYVVCLCARVLMCAHVHVGVCGSHLGSPIACAFLVHPGLKSQTAVSFYFIIENYLYVDMEVHGIHLFLKMSSKLALFSKCAGVQLKKSCREFLKGKNHFVMNWNLDLHMLCFLKKGASAPLGDFPGLFSLISCLEISTVSF